MQPDSSESLSYWAGVWQGLLSTLPKIAIVIGVCFVLWFIIIRIINRVTKKLVAKADQNRMQTARKAEHTSDLTHVLMSQRRKQRAEAISSLLRSVTTVIFAVIGIASVLAQLNINIGPIVASASVIGVAVGFGAQSLVKDYLSGIFLILEDQFGVGDLVDLGPVVGTVEDVTLRVTQVRDGSGVVWYVRNGEILRVANRSQGWTMALVDIPVGYNEDLERVRTLIEAVADDMDGDAAYDDMLLGKPSYAGVESVSGDAVFIRVTAKTAPEQQTAVTRVLRERIKTTFDRAGIRMPTTANAGEAITPIIASRPAASMPAGSTGPGQPPKTYGVNKPTP